MRHPVSDLATLRALRRPWLWVLAAVVIMLLAGTGALALVVRRERAVPASATLVLDSTPPGATVLIDGKARARTPAGLKLAPGTHRVTLRLTRYDDAPATVQLARDAT